MLSRTQYRSRVALLWVFAILWALALLAYCDRFDSLSTVLKVAMGLVLALLGPPFPDMVMSYERYEATWRTSGEASRSDP